jgi:hypothetical protein
VTAKVIRGGQLISYRAGAPQAHRDMSGSGDSTCSIASMTVLAALLDFGVIAHKHL